ncbi:hypothetical protein ACFWUQ_22850 [Streptomyces sp. NPDC058662]
MSVTGHEDSPPAECDGWSDRPDLVGLRHGRVARPVLLPQA